jgi:hypothetical protein
VTVTPVAPVTPATTVTPVAPITPVVPVAPATPVHAVVSGTANADTLTSASKTDILHGDAGKDLLFAANGPYKVEGGEVYYTI